MLYPVPKVSGCLVLKVVTDFLDVFTSVSLGTMPQWSYLMVKCFLLQQQQFPKYGNHKTNELKSIVWLILLLSSQSYIERRCNGVLDAMHNWATLCDHGCKLVLMWCPSPQQGENVTVEPPGLLCIVQKCCYFLQTIPLLSSRYHGYQPSTTPGPITLDSLHEVSEDSACIGILL